MAASMGDISPINPLEKYMKKWAWFTLIVMVAGAGIQTALHLKPQTQEEKAANEAEIRLARARHYQAIIAAKMIKNALRDPASVQWDSVRVNDDGSLVCLVYRAKNGFGGMNLAPAVSFEGKISTDGDVWTRYCKGKTLFDLKDEVEIALQKFE
jgi:hypothetical protein